MSRNSNAVSYHITRHAPYARCRGEAQSATLSVAALAGQPHSRPPTSAGWAKVRATLVRDVRAPPMRLRYQSG